MCLPLLILTDSLIIPAIFVWVDSSHFDVSRCEIIPFSCSFCSLSTSWENLLPLENVHFQTSLKVDQEMILLGEAI